MSELEQILSQLPDDVRKKLIDAAETGIKRDRMELFNQFKSGKPDWPTIKKILATHNGRLDTFFDYDGMKFKIIVSMRKIPEIKPENDGKKEI